MFIASSVINVITDVVMLVIPLVAIWNLHMATRRKVGIGAIFAVGTAYVCPATHPLSIHFFLSFRFFVFFFLNLFLFYLFNFKSWSNWSLERKASGSRFGAPIHTQRQADEMDLQQCAWVKSRTTRMATSSRKGHKPNSRASESIPLGVSCILPPPHHNKERKEELPPSPSIT